MHLKIKATELTFLSGRSVWSSCRYAWRGGGWTSFSGIVGAWPAGGRLCSLRTSVCYMATSISANHNSRLNPIVSASRSALVDFAQSKKKSWCKLKFVRAAGRMGNSDGAQAKKKTTRCCSSEQLARASENSFCILAKPLRDITIKKTAGVVGCF